MLFAFLGCGGDKEASNVQVTSAMLDEITKVEYRYGDRSVAPDYHRSYTITITENEKTITIDSYDEVLLTKQYENTPADFQAFKEELSKKGIKKHKKKDSACCGGTSETLRLYKDEVMSFDAYVYHCSGESGTLFLPAGTADFIRGQIPESIRSLVESTMN